MKTKNLIEKKSDELSYISMFKWRTMFSKI